VIESEKISNDIEAETSGFVHILVKEGNQAEVGSVVGLIAETKEELAELQKEKPQGRPAPAAASAVEGCEGKQVKETIPLTGMRGAIAEHMHRSLAISAQVTIMGEIDMTQTVKLRNDLVAQESVIGSRITYTAIFVLAVVRALRDNPVVNSSIIDNEIKVWENINIGVAIALEKGLTVPVIKDAGQKSLTEIDKAIKDLTEKARQGKLTQDDIEGGTFTTSNIGAVDVGYRFSTVIINQPQSAILGMGSITDRAQVRDGQIVIRPIVTYSFTYDHRAIDRAVAARFMATVIQLLENPSLLLA